MTISSWKNAALASLIPTIVMGQRVIFIPASSLSSSSMLLSPSALGSSPVMGSGSSGGEPPCRQRRLEPWRHEIRRVCHAEADDHCGIRREEEERDSDIGFSPMNTAFDNMEGVESLLNAMFAPSQVQNEEDHFQDMLNSMLGLSLRAFDETMVDVDSSAPSVEEMVDESEATEEEDVTNNISEDAAAPAEQAAENALDAMVASLAQRSVQQHEAIDTPEEDENTPIMIPVTNLPQILFQMGFDILSETDSTRRRLAEASPGETIDPHFQVKERLARRLTEYRTDLFFGSDGTVTMYTSSSGVSPFSSFMHGPSSMVEPTYETPLGMGSTFVDQCMRSRFDNGDLGESCHGAVEQLLKAVDNRYLIPPVTNEVRRTVEEVPAKDSWTRMGSSLPEKSNPFNIDRSNVMMEQCMFFMVLVFLLALNRYLSGSDDEEEEEEETSDGYTRMAEDIDTHEHLRAVTRVFVGVPVQVV